MALSPLEQELLFRGIWNGRINERNLPVNQYLDTAQGLEGGLINGFGQLAVEGDLLLLNDLNLNIYNFSGVKTFQQVQEMQKFIVDKDGNIRSFSDFKKDVDPIYDKFNTEWQRTEFNTAVGQSQSASQWQEIQEDKEIFPLLKYVTAGDDRVRPEHAAWDGIVRPVNDPWWDTHMPINSWNCRCFTIQLERDEEPVSSLKGVESNDDLLFATNAGKTGLVFREKGRNKHPYFNVPRQFELAKRDNFGLPSPTPLTPNDL